MQHKFLPLVAAAILAAAGTANAQQPAPKLEIGEWTGTVIDPSGNATDVTYSISYAGDTLKIKINAGQHGSFDTWDATVEADKISFKFRPGPEVSCVLNKKEEAYSGTCTADDGSVASMDLAPPQKAKS